MNKVETEFAHMLEAVKRGADVPLITGYFGRVLDWKFEAIKLKLAERTHYTPDMFVTTTEGIYLVELKGPFIRPLGAAKYKIAAEMYPMFRWSLWQKNKERGWRRLR